MLSENVFTYTFSFSYVGKIVECGYELKILTHLAHRLDQSIHLDKCNFQHDMFLHFHMGCGRNLENIFSFQFC